MKKIYVLLLILTISSVSFGQVINEVDADTPGTDVAEFIEIKHTPNTALDGHVVVLFNGNGDTSYAAYDLTGKITDANGLFIIANTALVAGTDIDMGASNKLQNGADAVALFTGAVTDFPNGTAVTSTNLLSGVVYDTGDGDDTGLLAAIGGVQYDERENSLSDTQSIQRKDDGTYQLKNITFRQLNDAATCDFSMSSPSAVCDNITAGVDTYTATVNFSGGGGGTFTVTADSGTVDLSAGNPTNDATGTITVTGIAEGTDVIINVTNGAICDVDYTVSAVTCIPALTLPLSESFTYSDGSLVGNSSWEHSGGATGNLLVASGKAVVQHGTPDEDLFLPFTPVSGSIYFAFDFSVIAQENPISGTDNEYFAHLKNDAYGYAARIDIVPPSAGGDFSIGIATLASTANSTWATDFDFDTDYRVTVKYDQINNTTDLWIDATAETDVSISGEIPTSSPIAVESFGLRQSDSSTNEGILIDNLTIAQTFSEILASNTVSTMTNFSLYPNPAKSGFVNITSTGLGAIQASVFDILGKQVINAAVANERLDVSSLNTGVYIVKLTQDSATSTKKLIIQ